MTFKTVWKHTKFNNYWWMTWFCKCQLNVNSLKVKRWWGGAWLCKLHLLIDQRYETYWCSVFCGSCRFIKGVYKWWFCKQCRWCPKLLSSVYIWMICCESCMKCLGNVQSLTLTLSVLVLIWTAVCWTLDLSCWWWHFLVAILCVITMHKWCCSGRWTDLMLNEKMV